MGTSAGFEMGLRKTNREAGEVGESGQRKESTNCQQSMTNILVGHAL